MQKIELKLASDKDRGFLRNIRNENRQFFFKKKYITELQHKKWLQKQFASKKCFIFIVFKFEDRRQIKLGTISLVNVDFRQKTAELGRFVILAKYRYLGLGKLVLKKFKEICKTIKINKITLYLRNDNKHAIGLYLNSGFKMTDKIKNKIYMEKII